STFASAAYPVAQWGARIAAKPSRDWYVMTAVSNGDQKLARNSAHGADFSFRRDASVFIISEIDYLHNQQDNAPGLPGNYKFGGYYDSMQITDLYHDQRGGAYVLSGLPARSTHNNYGVYVLLDQEIYRESDLKHIQGLTPFVEMTFAPADVN